MLLGNVITAVSLRKCFYLSAAVLVLSTLMAAVIIVKLSPLEAVKCQPQPVTAAVEWSTLATGVVAAAAGAGSAAGQNNQPTEPTSTAGLANNAVDISKAAQ